MNISLRSQTTRLLSVGVVALVAGLWERSAFATDWSTFLFPNQKVVRLESREGEEPRDGLLERARVKYMPKIGSKIRLRISTPKRAAMDFTVLQVEQFSQRPERRKPDFGQGNKQVPYKIAGENEFANLGPDNSQFVQMRIKLKLVGLNGSFVSDRAKQEHDTCKSQCGGQSWLAGYAADGQAQAKVDQIFYMNIFSGFYEGYDAPFSNGYPEVLITGADAAFSLNFSGNNCWMSRYPGSNMAPRDGINGGPWSLGIRVNGAYFNRGRDGNQNSCALQISH